MSPTFAMDRRLSASTASNEDDALRDRNNLEYLKYSAIGHQRSGEVRAQEQCVSTECEYGEEHRDSLGRMDVGGYNRRASRSLGDPSRVEQVGLTAFIVVFVISLILNFV